MEIAQKREKFNQRKLSIPMDLPSVKPVQELTDQEQDLLLNAMVDDIFHCHCSICSNHILLSLFQDLSSIAIKDLELYTNGSDLYLPLKDVYDEIVGYKVLSSRDHIEKSLPAKNSYGCVIKRNQKKDSTTAVVVLTAMDYLALASQKNLNQTIICLPHGFNALPQECLPLMEKYQKLILWFDYNCSTAGWDVARNFAKKLDERRCFLIRPTDNQASAFDALKHQLDLKSIISKSLPLLHKSITTFGSLREDVLSDLQNIDKVQGVKWKRYPTLSKLLKGHRKGELSILTGSTGCGKTTFMSEYSLDLALQGVTTLWGSFEIRNTRLATTLLRQLAGHPFDPVANLADFNYWADAFERLPVYFMTFHGQQTIKVVMEAIEHATYVNDIQHVIIDNVQFMMGISEEVKHGDRFWKQDAIIAAFRAFATKKNCHVTLVIHPRKEKDTEDLSTSSIFGSAKASQEADNVLIIQDKRLTSIRGKKFLQVAKNRYSGDLGIMPLDFDKESLSYAQKMKVQRSNSGRTPDIIGSGGDGGPVEEYV